MTLRRFTLPRRVSTALEGRDFTAQVFKFCQDVLTFLEAVKVRLEEQASTPVDGGVPAAHAASHLPSSGSDPLTVGTTADSFCVGDDARLSDDRTASGLRTATTVVDVSAATAPTAGQVLTALGTTDAEWQSPDAGADSELFAPPDSPNATLDDEFLGTSLDSKWTFRDATGATVTPSGAVDPYTAFATGDPKASVGRPHWNSWLQVQVKSNNTDVTLCQPYTVPTNVLIWTRVAPQRSPNALTNNAGLMCLAFFAANGSGNPDVLQNMVYLGYQPDAGAGGSYLEFGRYTAGVSVIVQTGSPQGIAQGAVHEYFILQKLGTTFHGWCMAAGRGITYMGSTTHASTMAFVGYWMREENSAGPTPGNRLMNTDFFRVVEASSYLP